MITSRHFIEPLTKGRENARFLQSSHSKKNAKEEENSGHIDFVENRSHTLFHGAIAMRFATIEHFGHCPEQAQHEEDAHIRRKFSEAMEERH